MHRPRLSPARGPRCGPPPPPPPRILSYTPAAAPLHLKTILSRPHIRSLATVPFFCSSFLAKPFKESAAGALQKAPLFLFSLEPTPIRPGPLPSVLDKITRGLACPAKGPVLGPHEHFASRHCAAWPIRRSPPVSPAVPSSSVFFARPSSRSCPGGRGGRGVTGGAPSSPLPWWSHPVLWL